ncbi:MAG: ABC transporter permease [Mycoplasma sp.]|nr:ABC transporter permease [Candidatus Hennigella equi]
MGDLGSLLDLTFIFTAILLAGALSGYLSERAGIVNLGIDGMMCIGALFFGIFSSTAFWGGTPPFATIIVALLLTMICTMIMGALHAFVCIHLKADHTIAGTAINLVGLALATFLNPSLANLLNPGESKIMCKYFSCLPMGSSLFGSSLIIFLVVLAIGAVIFFVVNKTKVGLRFRAVGENPNAVDAQGISVIKYQWIAVLLSSAMAGLAGGLFLFKVNAFNGDVQSMGYLSLAILITGGWKVPKMAVFAVVFALFNAAAGTTTFTQLGIPQLVVFSIPYIITLVILLFSGRKNLPPAHSGIPFEKGAR